MQQLVNIKIGTAIIVELNTDECYSGRLAKVNPDFKRLTLINVTDLKSGKEIKGYQYYYKSEVKKVRPLDDSEASDEVINGNSHVMETEPLKVNNEDLKRIQNNIANATYIKQCDRSYHQALAELKRAEIIAVSFEDERFVRLKEGSLLVMCTTENIFIFDIKLLGEVFKEIKAILSSPIPRKVVHNSSLIADYLLHRQRCELNAIFDTAAAHMQIEKEKQIIGLRECLQKYLNLPEGLLDLHQKIDWDSRPLSKELMFVAASKAAYLIRLYFVMAHDILLKPFNDESMKFSKSFASNNDQVDVFGQISVRRNPGTDNVKFRKIKISKS